MNKKLFNELTKSIQEMKNEKAGISPQRYTYFFRYRGGKSTDKPIYVTTAYSVLQAVKQLQERHPNKSISMYFDNEVFDITRKVYVPKKPASNSGKSKDKYTQMDFKGFTSNNPWPSSV